MLRGIVLGAAMSLCCLDMAFAATPKVDFVYRPSEKDIVYEARALAPVFEHTKGLVFTDIRGISNFDNTNELNLGIGARALFNKNIITGAYYFYDQRQENDLTYKQSTIGAEVLTEWLEARANFYIPFDDEAEITNTLSYNGAQPIITSTTKHQTLKGQDGEIGLKLSVANNELGFYGGMYKFTGTGVEIKGTKVRAQFTLAPELIPTGLSVNMGVEYDYNDNEDDRQVTGTFRVGYAFGMKSSKHNKHHHRMLQPIVRDVDIRTAEATTKSENAVLKVTQTDNTVLEFKEGASVTNWQELLSAVNDNRTTDGKLIIVENNLGLFKTLNLLSNDIIIGNDKYEVVGVESGASFTVDNSTKAPLVIANTTSADISSNVKGVLIETPHILYDGHEYTRLDFATTKDDLSPTSQHNNGIIVLDKDVIDLEGGKLAFAANRRLAIIGKGEITLKLNNNQLNNNEFIEKFVEERTITSNVPDDIIRGYGNEDATLEGFDIISTDHRTQSVQAQPGRMLFAYNINNVKMKFKNVIMKTKTNAYDYNILLTTGTGSLSQFENVQFFAKSSPNGIFHSRSMTHNTSLNDQYINQELDGGSILNTRGLTKISGNLVLDVKDTTVWEGNNEVNGYSPIVTLAKGTTITVQPAGVKKDEYYVTQDVTLGSAGILSPLYNKPVNLFDLSTLSSNISKLS